MEAQWVGQRAHLRHLLTLYPQWSSQQLADAVGCSKSMVWKWRKRFAQADPTDISVLFSRSRAPHHRPPRVERAVITRLLEIRLAPPEQLQRVPGPRAILYYLHRDPDLLAAGVRLPRSTRTVWRILHQEGLLGSELDYEPSPWPQASPLQEVQVDFKDVSTVPADPDGKRQHVIEVCNFVDSATSILLLAQVHQDFHAQTAFEAVVEFLRAYGLPVMLTFDRDPRWVGSASGRDFPSALCRFLLCVGVQPNILPPQHPELNAFVERYHRSYKAECLLVHRPATLAEVKEVTENYLRHYNEERPHQGRACGNQPPRVACPALPVRPALPQEVDPDAWLTSLHGRAYPRRVKTDGQVVVDNVAYYIKRALAGQIISLQLNAPERLFEVWLGKEHLKQMPIKGLQGQRMALEPYIEWMSQQARSEERTRLMRQRAQRRAG